MTAQCQAPFLPRGAVWSGFTQYPSHGTLEWLAIVIVVAGVVIVSVKRDSSRRFTSMGKMLLLLLGASILLVAADAGVIRSTSVTMMLYAMRREEVSRVVPIINTYPVFVAVMAVPLLGETLGRYFY